jgi:hypothetical protein
MDGIVHHKTDGHAVEPSDMYIKHGSKRKRGKKPRVGTCVLNGNMGPQAGSAWRISSKANLLKLMNMLLPRVCLTLLILCGGPQMSSRSAAESLPPQQNVTTSGLTSLELSSKELG